MLGDIKKKVVPSLVIVTVSMIPFVLWVTLMSESKEFLWMVLVSLFGFVMGFLYLMCSLRAALKLALGITIPVAYMFLVTALPNPWNIASIVAFFVVLWILGLMRKRKGKKELLQMDSAMTEAKTSEITAIDQKVDEEE